jgi:hypothetical protein
MKKDFNAEQWCRKANCGDTKAHRSWQEEWRKMPKMQQRFMLLACDLYYPNAVRQHGLAAHSPDLGLDFLTRAPVMACLDAAYSHTSSVLIELEGTPPKGSFVLNILPGGLPDPFRVFYATMWGGGYKRLPASKARIVAAFVREQCPKDVTMRRYLPEGGE